LFVDHFPFGPRARPSSKRRPYLLNVVNELRRYGEGFLRFYLAHSRTEMDDLVPKLGVTIKRLPELLRRDLVVR